MNAKDKRIIYDNLKYHISMRNVDKAALAAGDEKVMQEIGKLMTAGIEAEISNLFTGASSTASTAANTPAPDLTLESMVEMIRKLGLAEPIDYFKKIVVSKFIPPPMWDTRYRGERIMIANKKSFDEAIKDVPSAPAGNMAAYLTGIPIVEDDELAIAIIREVFNVDRHRPISPYSVFDPNPKA